MGRCINQNVELSAPIMNRPKLTAAAIVAATVATALATAAPALANPEIDAAVATLATIPADPAKLDAYCKAVAVIHASGSDPVQSDLADDKFDTMLKSFGAAFDNVVTLSHDFEDDSAEGKKLNAGFAAVEANCKF